VVIRPGLARYVTDRPAHLLDPETEWAYLQDCLTPGGKLVQRKGWPYDGTVADTANNLYYVYRAKFTLAGVTRTITGAVSAGMLIHNPSSAGTSITAYAGGLLGIPRCMYRDELIICVQNGTTPFARYSGASVETSAAASPTWTAGEATLTGATFGSTPGKGSYATVAMGTNGASGSLYHAGVRLTAVTSTSSVTADDIKASTTVTAGVQGIIRALDQRAAPCVSVYNTGTVTAVADGTVTGYGTKWAADMSVQNQNFCVLINDGGTWKLHSFKAVGSDTTLTGGYGPTISSKAAYHIASPPPFKDAASHKGSLWGAGVAGYSNRVYVGPPGWNPSLPPGAVPPFDPSVAVTSTDPRYFLLQTIDVPNPDDSDPIVALLSSQDALWVLKRNSIHGIQGTYPDFSQSPIALGVGCIDLRSAIATDEGLFFASEQGIFWSPDGQDIVDITRDKMNREWRALMRSWDANSYVTCGVANGHLVVSGKFGSTAASYLYDLQRREWMGTLSNITARHMFSARISGEVEALYYVDDSSQGRVMNFAPAINTSGIAKDGNGTAPRAKGHTASNLKGDFTGESRLLYGEVVANPYDVGAAGATKITSTLEHSGGLLSGGTGVQTKTLDAINSDAVDLLDRYKLRDINRSGRQHQFKFDVTPTGTNDANTKVELSEITLTFRDGRPGT
jgi:hypothetical protein